jgi:hypothetical protein
MVRQTLYLDNIVTHLKTYSYKTWTFYWLNQEGENGKGNVSHQFADLNNSVMQLLVGVIDTSTHPHINSAVLPFCFVQHILSSFLMDTVLFKIFSQVFNGKNNYTRAHFIFCRRRVFFLSCLTCLFNEKYVIMIEASTYIIISIYKKLEYTWFYRKEHNWTM